MENVWYVKIGKKYFRIEKVGSGIKNPCIKCPLNKGYSCVRVYRMATGDCDASCYSDNYKVDELKHLKGASMQDAEDYIGVKPIKIKKSEVRF